MIIDFPIHPAKRRSVIRKRRALVLRDFEYIKHLPMMSPIAHKLYAQYQDELAEIDQALGG